MNFDVDKIDVNEPILLLGGGSYKEKLIKKYINLANFIIAVDGGANKLKKNKPKYIVGDLDSLRNKNKWKKKGVKLIRIKEQDTTDFEKCLYLFNSKLFICLGFSGKRLDHFFSVCSSLIKYSEKKIILINKKDIIFHVPKKFEIDLPLKTRISFIPFNSNNKIKSSGLKWNLTNIDLCFSKSISISNLNIEKKVIINCSDIGMLGVLPKKFLKNLVYSFND